jgi:hypothetical protein
MQRITLWLTATLTVIALVTSYQANNSGTGKVGHQESAPGVTSEHIDKPAETK